MRERQNWKTPISQQRVGSVVLVQWDQTNPQHNHTIWRANVKMERLVMHYKKKLNSRRNFIDGTLSVDKISLLTILSTDINGFINRFTLNPSVITDGFRNSSVIIYRLKNPSVNLHKINLPTDFRCF